MARKKKKDRETISIKDNKQEKITAVNIAMQQIDEQFGTGSIMKLGQDWVNKKVPAVSTGCISLDLALGIGGLPYGRIVEIFGPEASGKTTLCLHVIAEAQKKGGVAAFIDAEHALDPQRAKAIGVNVDELLLSQPDTGEQALEITETLIRSGGVDIVVIDSVAALVPKAEIEGEMGDSVIGLQARLMSKAMRKLAGSINKSKCMIIFTNQLREKIGIMFGNPEVTPGGRALKFYASIRIDLRKIGNIQDGDIIVGSRHRAKVVKNKVAPPFRICELDILNDGGISYLGSLIDEAINQDVIQKAGAFLKYKGEVIAQGREAARKELSKKPKLVAKIEKEIWASINNAK
jgi:recombination protein RecA